MYLCGREPAVEALNFLLAPPQLGRHFRDLVLYRTPKDGISPQAVWWRRQASPLGRGHPSRRAMTGCRMLDARR